MSKETEPREARSANPVTVITIKGSGTPGVMSALSFAGKHVVAHHHAVALVRDLMARGLWFGLSLDARESIAAYLDLPITDDGGEFTLANLTVPEYDGSWPELLDIDKVLS